MVFKGRKLKGFFFPVFGLVFLFITSLGNTPAYALSNNFQQYFDSWTGSTANTSQWSLTYDPSDGVNYTLNPFQFLASSGSPVADPYAPVTVVQPGPTTVVLPGAPVTAEYAAIEGDNTCNTCSAVTLTYSDPQSPVPPVSGAYIMIDVLNTGSAGKNYQLIVTDTKGNTISDSTDNVLVDCLSPPPNIREHPPPKPGPRFSLRIR